MAARNLRVGDWAYHYYKHDEATRIESTCPTCNHTTYEYDRNNLFIQVDIYRFIVIGVGENCYFYTYEEPDDRSSIRGQYWHSINSFPMEDCFSSPEEVKTSLMGGQNGKRIEFSYCFDH